MQCALTRVRYLIEFFFHSILSRTLLSVYVLCESIEVWTSATIELMSSLYFLALCSILCIYVFRIYRFELEEKCKCYDYVSWMRSAWSFSITTYKTTSCWLFNNSVCGIISSFFSFALKSNTDDIMLFLKRTFHSHHPLFLFSSFLAVVVLFSFCLENSLFWFVEFLGSEHVEYFVKCVYNNIYDTNGTKHIKWNRLSAKLKMQQLYIEIGFKSYIICFSSSFSSILFFGCFAHFFVLIQKECRFFRSATFFLVHHFLYKRFHDLSFFFSSRILVMCT